MIKAMGSVMTLHHREYADILEKEAKRSGLPDGWAEVLTASYTSIRILADAIDTHLADKAGARVDGELVCCGGQDCGCMGATVGQQRASAIPDELLKIINKLRRFEECAEDGEGADIGRPWFDALTFLGLLKRVQRSPAVWEMTDAGERAIAFGDRICAP